MRAGQIDEIVEDDYWQTRDCELTINSIMFMAEVKMITITTQSKMITTITLPKRMMKDD